MSVNVKIFERGVLIFQAVTGKMLAPASTVCPFYVHLLSSELARIQTFSAKILRFKNRQAQPLPTGCRLFNTGEGFIRLSRLDIHDDPAAAENKQTAIMLPKAGIRAARAIMSKTHKNPLPGGAALSLSKGRGEFPLRRQQQPAGNRFSFPLTNKEKVF